MHHHEDDEDTMPGGVPPVEVAATTPTERIEHLEREVRELREANQLLRSVAAYLAGTRSAVHGRD